MTIYYEILSDGTIGRSTPNSKVAAELELTLQTDQEIVYGHDGKRYFNGNEPEVPAQTYIDLRVAHYPRIEDQLDMIYHDFDNWKERITEIKKNYPKI